MSKTKAAYWSDFEPWIDARGEPYIPDDKPPENKLTADEWKAKYGAMKTAQILKGAPRPIDCGKEK